MKFLILCLCFITTTVEAQSVQYKPNRKLDKTVAENYYNTEFIFFKNISDGLQELSFEVIENTLLPEWSATICTNTQCYNTIPKFGNLGNINPSSEGYISFNLSANSSEGTGQVRFLVTSENDSVLNDTITFKYTVNKDGKIIAKPWANLNFNQGVVTILLEDKNIEGDIHIYNSSGQLIAHSPLISISSFSLRTHEKGVYFVIISDHKGRMIKQKVMHYY